ncbi:MAG: hypothetical protein ABJC04_02915, partial [Verrucomicrobiota bacterium]
FREQQSSMNGETNLHAPELYAGENEDVGPQRILKIKPDRTYIDVLADSQYFFTDNTFLSDQKKISTAIAVNTLQLALSPTPYELSSGAFAPVVGFRSQWYNYGLDGANDGLDRLDFNAQTIFAGAHYIFKENWRASVTFDYTRLLDQHSYHEFYTEYVPAVGLHRSIPVNDNLAFSAEWRTAYHITHVDPFPRSDVNDRLDNSLTFSANYLIVPKLVVSPYYQFTHYYYPHTAFNEDRNDFVNTIGVSLAYYFNPRIFVRIFANGDFKRSDDSRGQQYDKFDTGIDLTLNFRF